MQKRITYRPKANWFWAFAALTLDALFLAQAILYPQANSNLWFDLLIGVAVAALVVLLWIRPKLVLDEKHLEVVNPFRTETIAYDDIIDIDTKWALLIHHSQRSTRVWVAPANGKFRWIADSTQRWRFSRVPQSQPKEFGFTTVSESLNSDSGVAATLIRQRLETRH